MLFSIYPKVQKLNTLVPTNTNVIKLKPLPVLLILEDSFWISGEANKSRMCSTPLLSLSPSPLLVHQSRSQEQNTRIQHPDYSSNWKSSLRLPSQNDTDAPTPLPGGSFTHNLQHLCCFCCFCPRQWSIPFAGWPLLTQLRCIRPVLFLLLTWLQALFAVPCVFLPLQYSRRPCAGVQVAALGGCNAFNCPWCCSFCSFDVWNGSDLTTCCQIHYVSAWLIN